MSNPRIVPSVDVVELYVKYGMTAAEIAPLANMGRSTVYDHLRVAGIEPKRRGARVGYSPKRLPLDAIEEMAKMYIEEKMSISQIAKKLGKDSSTIHHHLKRSGIKMRERGEATRLRFSQTPMHTLRESPDRSSFPRKEGGKWTSEAP